MPKLIMMDATGHARQIQLKPQTNTVGRGPHNDIVIDSLRASRSHAVITVDNALVHITDLHSTNGTFVNGHLVDKQALAHGDAIQVGSIEIRFVAGDQQLNELEALRMLTAPDPLVDLDRDQVTKPDEVHKPYRKS
ncbi:FHA domain-containing protein [Variovorax sp. J22R133]|uniref:FHA domain-containing protein n=1 Tax=Variovorax brevis TaxID=3053503 RepID=UPI002575F9B6|nr:FHA domain-containing protein [Variovorax sp. J22R133]MDM0115583.1 FHA domain-containing protein [Variovorax sp. J22R133]